MCGSCIQNINEHPELIYSDTLIKTCHTVQQSQQGTISSETPYDSFMASSFCAYVRKMKELEILPILEYGNDEVVSRNINMAKSIFEISNPSQYAKDINLLESADVLTPEQDRLLSQIRHSEDYFSPFLEQNEPENDKIVDLPFFYN